MVCRKCGFTLSRDDEIEGYCSNCGTKVNSNSVNLSKKQSSRISLDKPLSQGFQGGLHQTPEPVVSSDMIYCRHCGQRASKDAQFCPHCGGALIEVREKIVEVQREVVVEKPVVVEKQVVVEKPVVVQQKQPQQPQQNTQQPPASSGGGCFGCIGEVISGIISIVVILWILNSCHCFG